jgi:DUF1365 family protein
MQSSIYIGVVRHRRHAPTEHEFAFPLFMMYLDLAELPGLFKGWWGCGVERTAPVAFHREDHFGDAQIPLDRAVRNLVEQRVGDRPQGPIRLLTHLRYFGYCFNPISIYYCFDADDTQVRYAVLEVNNTPWGEQHLYVLDNSAAKGPIRAQFEKAMHVSPFMDMDQDYRCMLSQPGDRLIVHMDNLRRGDRLFDATLDLERRPLTRRALWTTLLKFPLMTQRVLVAIYWQALRLYLKRVPFHAHP